MTDDEMTAEQMADDDEAMELFGPTVLRAINAQSLGVPIEPSQIATEAMRLIDPDGVSPEGIRELCHMALERLARQMLDRAVEIGKAELIRTH